MTDSPSCRVSSGRRGPATSSCPLRIGLVNFVVERDEIHEEVVSYARRMASNAPLTMRAAKAAIDAWERGGRQDELDDVRQLVNACFDSEDYREGRRAFAEKRPPQFAGR